MAGTRNELTEQRRRLKAEYGKLFEDVSALLFHHDPLSINYKSNADEYEPEVGTILPRLRNCGSAEDVCRTVHEEFIHWFGADNIGPQEYFSDIAKEIWARWQRFNAI